MKTCNKCGEEKPLDMFGKRRDSKDGLMNMCKACNSARAVKWGLENRDRHNQNVAKYMSGKGREVINSAARLRYQNDTGRFRNKSAAYSKQNRGACNARSMKRHAAKKQRTVSWANDQVIASYYLEAKRLEELTGIKFHVDHIIPLQGKLVSGLHVENNLQLLTEHENCSKSNAFSLA